MSQVAPGRTPLGKPGATRLAAAKARGLLPNNRWTLGISDTLAALVYWIGFLATLAADVLRDVVRSFRRRASHGGQMRTRSQRARS
jgi:hypothetical protein